MDTKVSMTVGDKHTIEEFQRILEERIKWLGGASKNTVAACAIDVLRSIRAQTIVASASRTKIDNLNVASAMTASWKTVGKRKLPCLRIGGNEYHATSNERVIFCSTKQMNTLTVFQWVYSVRENKNITYWIVAASKGEAKRKCKEIVKKRVERYKGLARRAISFLMMKTVTTNVTDNVNQLVNMKADQVTTKIEHNAGNEYGLTLEDGLNYAIAALRNKDASVDLALMKATNKITSVLNMKCKNILGFEKLDVPFPEVKQRK